VHEKVVSRMRPRVGRNGQLILSPQPNPELGNRRYNYEQQMRSEGVKAAAEEQLGSFSPLKQLLMTQRRQLGLFLDLRCSLGLIGTKDADVLIAEATTKEVSPPARKRVPGGDWKLELLEAARVAEKIEAARSNRVAGHGLMEIHGLLQGMMLAQATDAATLCRA
jgi:hypothetical protein